MNALVKPENLSPVEEFVLQVLPENRVEELHRSMPAHIKPALFQRNLLNAIMINPNLMKYLPGLVFREVSKAAALGLYLDPQLGEAYIIEAYNYKTREIEPQLRIGYRGMCKLARQSGEVSLIYAHEVCQKDFIDADMGSTKLLIHKPQLFTDRGPVIGYYAVVKYRDGAFDYEPMSVDQCHAIRDRSDAWKAYKDGKIKTTPWATDEDEMSKKTTIRRLMKRAPQSPELSEAIRIEDEAEGVIDTQRAPRIDTRRAPAPNKTAEPKQIEAQATETVDTLHQDERERETVPSAQADEPRPDRRRAPAPNPKPAETKPAEPQKMVGIAMQRGYEARKASNIRRGAVPGEYRDAARKDEASAWQDGWDKADAELKANVGLFNPEATRKAFTAALAKATCEEDVTDAWNKHVAPFLEEMSKPDERDFDKLYVDAKRDFVN